MQRAIFFNRGRGGSQSLGGSTGSISSFCFIVFGAEFLYKLQGALPTVAVRL